MSRSITSPALCWPGQIHIPDALSWPQYLAWQDGIAKLVEQPAIAGAAEGAVTAAQIAANDQSVSLMLPAICVCVERWELGGGFPAAVTPQTFPATPREASLKLLAAIVGAINDLVVEADHVPNA